MPQPPISRLLVATFVVALPACKSSSSSSPGVSQAAQVIAPADAGPPPAPVAGRMRDEEVFSELRVYWTPAPRVDPKQTLHTTCARDAQGFERIDRLVALGDRRDVAEMYVARVALADFPVPDGEYLKSVGGVGLSPEQIAAVQKSEGPAIFDFAAPHAQAWPTLRDSAKLVDCLASATDGLIYDASTRELFTPAAWRARRLDGWKDGKSELSRHYVTHTYPDVGGYARAVTIGLERFGLPNLVINGVLPSQTQAAGVLIMLVAARLEVAQALPRDGRIDLDLDEPWAQAVLPADAPLLPGAQRKARLHVSESTPQPGDGDVRLWEIGFDGFPGADVHERQNAAFTQLFGKDDQATYHAHDDAELNAARERARARLPDVAARFRAGLAPGASLMVKAPFTVSKGNAGVEWMWVEVTEWKGHEIRGVLANQPNLLPELHQGATVKVRQDDLFDYRLEHADGTFEGGETDAILMKREPEKAQ